MGISAQNRELFERLFGPDWETNQVEILILERPFSVPARANILRALDYVAVAYDIPGWRVRATRHCWQGSCLNCVLSYREVAIGGAELDSVSCQMVVFPGLRITGLPRYMNPDTP